MADFSRQSTDLASPPPQSQLQRPPSMSFGSSTDPAPENDPQSHSANGAGVSAAQENTSTSAMAVGAATAGAKPDMPAQVQEVLASDIGVSTMLNRLKQSIASAREFAAFLKKRSDLEDGHAKGMKKLCRMTQDNIHQMDHRQGSFSHAYEEMLIIHDRMAENGVQFAVSLHQMQEDLIEVANIAEKHRKGWKQNGLAAEARLQDIESAMRKSKAKYDALADEYERVKTGEARQGGRFGFKGPKSAAQQEEDLLRKTQAADTDYMTKVQNYQAEKATMDSSTRPEAIKALTDLVRECDSGTTLQMQKFASFNEKLLLSNGLVISPLKHQSTIPGHNSRSSSMKEVIQAVDNHKDLEEYLLSFHSKLPPKPAEAKYERNPVLNPQQNMTMGSSTQMQQQARPQSQQQPQALQMPPVGSMSMGSRTGGFDVSSPAGVPSPGYGQPPSMPAASQQRPSSQTGHERSFSHGALLNQSSMAPQQPQSNRNSTQAAPPSHARYGNGSISQAGPPQLGALPFQTQQSPQEHSPPRHTGPSAPMQAMPPPPQQPPSSGRSVSPPSNAMGPGAGGMSKPKQVFGVTLDRLYERDGLAVPMVVYQCIQAVDLYGLAVEGIYRLSGSATHIQKLKNGFDTDSDSRNLDFRNPENFFHDVNSVAGLLKQFCRDLPDPLFTAEHYKGFVEAAKADDDIVRRDSLHAIINSLPDPNYATLRALTLHLHRVMENSGVNRMNSQNLAIVFGPTLMGTAPGANIADAGWQVRAIDTILQNTYQIFDED
ncbi:RhoGAP-domain-containing protein [Apiospora arundinis]|uniref:RhoGAP-domain-containing protein n=1 Tax=Apiospora arundinis TaxID=335852 RepID=A0ABR2HQN7_9PEZI